MTRLYDCRLHGRSPIVNGRGPDNDAASAASLEKRFHVLLGVVVGRLEVVQLLLQIGDLGLHIGGFLGLTSLDFLGGGKDEPIAMLAEAAGCSE